ncbi:MAG: hypothetical protein N2114_01225 [Candidatus Goldbacteria bacterium]|nr:hypothetical protein [Candidatus Goldiibacteriota bacterium]
MRRIDIKFYKHLFSGFYSYVSVNIIVLFITIIINFLIPKYLSISDFGYYRKLMVLFSFSGVFSFGIIDYVYCKFSEYSSNLGLEDFKHNFQLLLTLSISLFFIGLLSAYYFFDVFILFLLIIFSNLYSLIEVFYNSKKLFKKINSIRLKRVLLYSLFLLLSYIFNFNTFNLLLSLCLSYLFILIFESKDLGLFESYRVSSFSFNTEFRKIKFGLIILLGNLISIFNSNIDKIFLSIRLNNDQFGIYIFPNIFFIIFKEFVQSLKSFLFPNINSNDYKFKVNFYTKISYTLMFFFCLV